MSFANLMCNCTFPDASNPVKEVQPSGRIIWHGTLLVTDSSLALCQVKVRMPGRPLVNLEGQVCSRHLSGWEVN